MAPPNRHIAAALAAVTKEDRGRLLSALVRRIEDFQLAEDCLQDALESGLVHWARNDVPENPIGWLLRVAQRKAIDRFRRDARFEEKVLQLAALDDVAASEPAQIPDERLAMIFTCCHPALEEKSRVALTLRTIGGLTTVEIARAFLDREATMGQRLSRAKKKISAAGIPFAVPEESHWQERLHSVLLVIYLIFNEGYSAGSGDAAVRVKLCEEAIFLARLVDELRPGQAEVEGLIALMLLSHARRRARLDADGAFVPLSEQNTALWDATQIREGEAVLDRAIARGAAGPFQIQAAISALHVHGGLAGNTDWRQILLLYDSLYRLESTPVVALNRAVALAEVAGPEAGLQALDALDSALGSYQPYHAARAALLVEAGRRDAARTAYDQAVALCADEAQRGYLQRQRAQL